MANDVTVFGIADKAIFRVIGIFVTENVSAARGIALKAGVRLPDPVGEMPLLP